MLILVCKIFCFQFDTNLDPTSLTNLSKLLRPATLWKRCSDTGGFPVNFAKTPVDGCFWNCYWKHFSPGMKKSIPVDTRRRFNVYKTSIRRRRRRIDVETTPCVYWDIISPLDVGLGSNFASALLPDILKNSRMIKTLKTRWD